MLDYANMSIDAFRKAWQRTDFHFEYRMFYLDSLLAFTDTLGQSSYVARNCYLSSLEYNAYVDDIKTEA